MLSGFHQTVGEDDDIMQILLIVSNPSPLLGYMVSAHPLVFVVLLHVRIAEYRRAWD